MKIYHSNLWKAELQEVFASFPQINELVGKTVLITGATGLICSAIVDVFICYNETHFGKIGIVAAGRSRERIACRFADYSKQSYFDIAIYDGVSPDNHIEPACDYIIHGASNASPDLYTQQPVETMLGNIAGTKYLLDYARTHGTKRILYISSSEIYGVNPANEPICENQYGSINLLVPRNSYAISKSAAETLCVSYSAEYGVDTVIVRPGHIYGPTAQKTDRRVSSAWVFDAVQGKNITMKSDGRQIRSYCYCLDCASAILTVLLHGETCKAYNISNPDSIVSIKRIAEIISKAAGISLCMDIPAENERAGFNPMLNSSLDSTALQRLGWRGRYDAERGFTDTIEIIKSMVMEQS